MRRETGKLAFEAGMAAEGAVERHGREGQAEHAEHDRAREQRRNGRHLLQCQQQHQRSGQQRDP